MSPAPRRRAAVMEVPSAAVTLRWAWYLVSLFVPFGGILIALFLYDHEAREARRVGRNCLLIGFLVWVVFPFLVLAAILCLAVFALLGVAAGLMQAD